LGLALPVLWFLRKFSASLRHQLLVGIFLGLLILPLCAAIVPTWNIPVLADLRFGSGFTVFSGDQPASENLAQAEDSAPVTATPILIGPDFGTSSPAVTAHDLISTPITAANDPIAESSTLSGIVEWLAGGNLSIILLIVWSIGLLAVFVLQLVRWAGAGFIAETAATVENVWLINMAERLGREMGINQEVILVKSGMSAVTMTWGIRKPYIVLPTDAEEWSASETEAILRHELAHIRRNDNLIQFLAVFACALYWFNPLAWKLLRRLQMEREIACDDFVLNSGTNASTYARYLMDMSIKLKGPKSHKVIPAVMAHSSNIKKRLLNILNPEANRRPAAVISAILCTLLIISAAIPVAAFRLWGDPDEKTSETYRMKGSTSYDEEGMWLLEVTITGDEGDFDVKADNVLLDPDSRHGYLIPDEHGYLEIKIERRGEELTYRVEGEDSDVEKYFYREGKEEPFTAKQDREFERLVERLTKIFMPAGKAMKQLSNTFITGKSGWDGWARYADRYGEAWSEYNSARSNARARASERARSSARARASENARSSARARANYRKALELYESNLDRYRERYGDRTPDLLIYPDDFQGWKSGSNSYNMRGSSANHDEGVLLTDVDLENSDGDFRAEIDNIILNEDDELGFHYNYGKGYIYLVKERRGKEYEYRLERRKTSDGWKEEKSFSIDGEEQDFDDDRIEEFKELIEEISDIFGPMHGYGVSPDYQSLSKTYGITRPSNVPSIMIAEGKDPFRVVTPSTWPLISQLRFVPGTDLLGYYPDGSDRDPVIVSLNNGMVQTYSDYDTPLVDFMEQLGNELEQIRNYRGGTLYDRAGREAIEKAYKDRHSKINSSIDRMMDDLRDDENVDAALRGVDEIFKQYLEMALEAYNDLGNQRSRNKLKDGLIELYEDFEDLAVAHLKNLDRRRSRVVQRDAKIKIYEAIAIHSDKAIEELMKQ